MGWETSSSGRQYYTRSTRIGGKVRREYIGSGESAARVAWLDGQKRQQREKERREARQESEALDGWMRWYFRAVENVLRSELTRGGFHQHNRGEWRKKRIPETKASENRTLSMTTSITNSTQQRALEELNRRKEERKRMQTIRVQALDTEIAVREAAVPDTEMERRAIINAAMNGDAGLEVQALACIRAYPTETVLGWGNPKDPYFGYGLSQGR